MDGNVDKRLNWGWIDARRGEMGVAWMRIIPMRVRNVIHGGAFLGSKNFSVVVLVVIMRGILLSLYNTKYHQMNTTTKTTSLALLSF